MADGTFANAFFADFLVPASFLEYFSAPPFTPGIGPEDSELPVIFTATQTSASVPEPATAILVALALSGFIAARRKGQR